MMAFESYIGRCGRLYGLVPFTGKVPGGGGGGRAASDMRGWRPPVSVRFWLTFQKEHGGAWTTTGEGKSGTGAGTENGRHSEMTGGGGGRGDGC